MFLSKWQIYDHPTKTYPHPLSVQLVTEIHLLLTFTRFTPFVQIQTVTTPHALFYTLMSVQSELIHASLCAAMRLYLEEHKHTDTHKRTTSALYNFHMIPTS